MLRSHAGWLPLAALALAACDETAIRWRDPVPAPPALTASILLGFDARGNLGARQPAAFVAPTSASQCVGSARAARDTTGNWYAVWWSLRPDSTADVEVSRSADGRSWDAPVRVDSADAGAAACRRPAPAIYVDGANVHVVYAMAAREGPGIFASHSMDGAKTFHAPVPIVYGERLGAAAIAARGDIVAVAYEDPNTNPRRIGLAFSRSLGHIFEHREVVSPPTGDAANPGLALGDGVIAVTWSPSADAAANVPASRMLREGAFR